MVLNFISPRYALLFLNFEIYIVHVINCEWSGSVNFPLHVFCMLYKLYFSNNWFQSGLHFRICITCFVSFGIKDSNFMSFEDYTFKFFCMFVEIIVWWKLILMLWCHLSFDIKYVMKTASEEFWKIRVSRVSIDRKLLSIDRVKQWPICLIQLIFDC